jgi:hypothetical protein
MYVSQIFRLSEVVGKDVGVVSAADVDVAAILLCVNCVLYCSTLFSWYVYVYLRIYSRD